MAEPRPQNWRRFVFPEPAFLSYAFGAFMSFTILEQYSFYRVSQMYGLSADSLLEEGTGGCKNSVNESVINSTLLELENQVQIAYILTVCSCYTPVLIYVKIVKYSFVGMPYYKMLPKLYITVHFTVSSFYMKPRRRLSSHS